MRVSVFPVVVSLCLSSCLSLSLAASAADLKVKVIDPQGAAVGRAQVSLLRSHDSKVMATQITSAEGVAILSLVDGERYQVQVLAPGFAVETVEVPASSSESRSRIGVEITVKPSPSKILMGSRRGNCVASGIALTLFLLILGTRWSLGAPVKRLIGARRRPLSKFSTGASVW